MFSKLLFTAFIVPLVSALSLNAPANPMSGGSITITWDWDQATDPTTFSIFLTHDVFHETYAISNNVDPSLETLTLTLPSVAAISGYTLIATNIGNVNQVYATSPSFSIGGSSSVSLSSTATGSSSTLSLRSTTTTTSSQSSLIIRPSSTTTPNAGLGSATDTSSVPTAPSTSGASRQLDFKFGGILVTVLAIGGVAILAL